MTQALVALVNSKTAITDLIDNRFYTRKLPQGLNEFPASTYRVNNENDNATFDSPSKLDFVSVDIQCYGKTYADVVELFTTFRKELEYESGTYAGIEIRKVRYIPSGMEDYLEDLELHTKQQELRIDYIRTLN